MIQETVFTEQLKVLCRKMDHSTVEGVEDERGGYGISAMHSIQSW